MKQKRRVTTVSHGEWKRIVESLPRNGGWFTISHHDIEKARWGLRSAARCQGIAIAIETLGGNKLRVSVADRVPVKVVPSGGV